MDVSAAAPQAYWLARFMHLQFCSRQNHLLSFLIVKRPLAYTGQRVLGHRFRAKYHIQRGHILHEFKSRQVEMWL